MQGIDTLTQYNVYCLNFVSFLAYVSASVSVHPFGFSNISRWESVTRIVGNISGRFVGHTIIKVTLIGL